VSDPLIGEPVEAVLGRQPVRDDTAPARQETVPVAADSSPDGATAGAPRQGRSRHLRLLGRASWNLIDQVLSALTNMVLAVLVAKAAGARAFDAFAVSFLLFSTMIGIERALVGQPLGIRHSDESGATRRRTVSRATGLVVGISVPAAALMLVAGLLFGGRLGTALIATAVVLPFLILQDACRMAFFAQSSAKLAALNDGLWAVLQFSAMGAIIALGAASATTLILAWGGSAAVCVLVALLQLRAVPDPGALLSWLREHRDLVGYFLGEYMLTTGAFNGGYLMVGAIIGDQAVGSIRAAQVLIGPLGIVAAATISFGLPELSRRSATLSSSSRQKVALATSVLMGGMSLVYTAVLLLIPDSLGELVFEQKWAGSQEVLLPLALASAAAGAALGPAIVIYAMGQARKTFRIMTIEAPMVFVFLIVGASVAGARGAAWGQLIDQTLIIGVWFFTLRRVLGKDRISSA
jgi:O-antigen/teichoic acid export membrane protein